MAAGGELQWELATNYGAISALSYDGTYIWMTVRFPSANARLMRFDPKLKKFIKPDGTVGDYTNAYVDLGADLYSGNGTAAISNGSIVGLSEGAGGYNVRFYNAADMTFRSKHSLPGCSTARAAFYSNNLWYWPAFNGGKSAIAAVNSSGGYSFPYVGTVGSYFGWVKNYGSFVLAGFEPAGTTIERINTSTWTRTWTSATAGSAIIDAVYDPIRDEIWCAVMTGEVVRMRASDGAFLRRDGVADAYAACLISNGNDSIISQGTTVLVNGSNLWTGGSNTSGWRLTRRSTSPTAVSGQLLSLGAKSSGHWIYLINHPCPQLVIDGTVYFAIGGPVNNYSWTAAGVGWIEDTVAAPTPTLQAVTPMAGPKTRLVFDLAVSVGTPTIGAPAAGIGITGATQVDSTTVDLVEDLAPVHPIGEAEKPPTPTVPTNAGAYVL